MVGTVAISASSDMATFERIVDKYGFPSLMLLLIISSVGYGLTRVLLWLEPRFSKAFEKHLHTMDTVCETLDAIKDDQHSIRRDQTSLAESYEKLAERRSD